MKVRCIRDRDNAWVRAGSVHEVERKDSYGWVMLVGGPCWFPMAWFEPVTNEAEAHAEQPKVDPYEAHRLKLDDELDVTEDNVGRMTEWKHPGATARLLRGLESEKVRERVKTFPKQGRNFALEGKR